MLVDFAACLLLLCCYVARYCCALLLLHVMTSRGKLHCQLYIIPYRFSLLAALLLEKVFKDLRAYKSFQALPAAPPTPSVHVTASSENRLQLATGFHCLPILAASLNYFSVSFVDFH